MAGEWLTKTLGEVCRTITDGAHQSPKTVQSGMPMASVKDLNFWGLDLNAARHISHEDYEALVRQGCKPLVGDVLIAKDGNSALDTVCVVEEPMDVVLLSSVAILRPDPDQIDSKYLKYYFMTPSVIEYLKSNFISGAAIPRVVLRDFKRAEITLPTLDDQRAIAHILGTLDDKIELNRRMNETLEAIARAIFKSWFVDFDPVRAKASGEAPESICQRLGLTPDLLALFPDRLVDSEHGEIPEGWEVKAAGVLADVGIGKTPPRKEPQWFSEDPEHVRWVSIRDMGLAGTFIQHTSERLTREAVERFNIRVVPDYTALLSFKLTIGRVTITDGEMTTNEAIAHFKLPAGSPLTTESLYLYLQQFDYTKLGSTSSIAEAVNSRMIRELPVVLPPEELLTSFSSLVRSNFERQRANARETTTLANIRDTLLPALLSGDLEVPPFDGSVGG